MPVIVVHHLSLQNNKYKITCGEPYPQPCMSGEVVATTCSKCLSLLTDSKLKGKSESSEEPTKP